MTAIFKFRPLRSMTPQPMLVAMLFAAWSCLGWAEQTLPGPPPGDIGKVLAEAARYQSGDNLDAFRHIEDWVRQSLSGPAARAQVEKALLKLLEPSSSFEAKRFACKQLEIVGSPAALPAISALLRIDETTSIGCLALSTFPRGEADRILRQALTWAEGTNRVQIINTLGDRRDLASLKMLAASARDPDQAVATAAIAALGKLGGPHARKIILSLNSDVSEPLSGVLAEATLRCAEGAEASGDKAAALSAYQRLLTSDQPLSIRRAALTALLPLESDQGERRILAILESEDSALKPVAIAAIPGLRSKTASEDCAAVLRHLTPEEQVWMIGSLAARGDVQAILAVAVSLSSPFIPVRHAAAEAIGRTGDASSVPLLVRTLYGDKTPEERRWIETALVNLAGSVETDRAIAAALKRSSGQARASIIVALVRREGPKAIPLLNDEAVHPDSIVSRAAFRALRPLVGASEAPGLLDTLLKIRDPEVRADAERTTGQALAAISDTAHRSALVREALGRARTVDSRRSLLSLLPDCADAPALAVLEDAAKDSDARVRAAAISDLAEWPDILAWDCLLGAYQRPDTDRLRSVALRGLVRMVCDENAHPDAVLVEHYRQLLAGAHGASDLKLILGALEDAAHPDALNLALPLLSNPRVRPEAEFAVKHIATAIKADHPHVAEDALRQIQPKP